MLVTTDLHLTDKPEDEYRWAIFKWLNEQLRDGEELLILGDLTDKKDGHSARLVNRVVDSLMSLRAKHVTILKGNHDYIDEQTPFFSFLNHTRHLRFVPQPSLATLEGVTTFLLPHTRTPDKDWRNRRAVEEAFGLICCHQTFDGAESGNGYRLTAGISSEFWSRVYGYRKLVLSGDIHKPQKLGGVIYVGTPYPVAFGDAHKPRVLRLKRDGKQAVIAAELHPPSIQRIAAVLVAPEGVDDATGLLEPLGLSAGDQCKLTIELGRADFHRWNAMAKKLRATLTDQGVAVHSIALRESSSRPSSAPARRSSLPSTRTATQALRAFCASRGVEKDTAALGEVILRKTEK